MSYQNQANLATDPLFTQRLAAGLAQEAQSKPMVDLAGMIMRNPTEGARVFMPFVASAPGFDTTYADNGQEGITDLMMLSAIQSAWPKVEALYFPPVEPTP
jgi:hypothetical protein